MMEEMLQAVVTAIAAVISFFFGVKKGANK